MRRATFYATISKSLGSQPEGEWVIEGIASTPNPDLHGDVVPTEALHGALDEFLRRGLIYWEHGWKRGEPPIGWPLEAKVTPQGLWIRAKLNKDSEQARRFWQEIVPNDEMVRRMGMSITAKAYGEPVVKSLPDGRRVRVLPKRMSLEEVSITGIPANPDTFLRAIKSLFTEGDDEMSEKAVNPVATRVVVTERGLVVKALLDGREVDLEVGKDTPVTISGHSSNGEMLAKSFAGAQDGNGLENPKADAPDLYPPENEAVYTNVTGDPVADKRSHHQAAKDPKAGLYKQAEGEAERDLKGDPKDPLARGKKDIVVTKADERPEGEEDEGAPQGAEGSPEGQDGGEDKGGDEADAGVAADAAGAEADEGDQGGDASNAVMMEALVQKLDEIKDMIAQLTGNTAHGAEPDYYNDVSGGSQNLVKSLGEARGGLAEQVARRVAEILQERNRQAAVTEVSKTIGGEEGVAEVVTGFFGPSKSGVDPEVVKSLAEEFAGVVGADDEAIAKRAAVRRKAQEQGVSYTDLLAAVRQVRGR